MNKPTVNDVAQFLEQWAPLDLQESYDNAGLICGNRSDKVTGVLVALDCTIPVLQEAVEMGCNLLVFHHPPVFKALKSITEQDAVGNMLRFAIQHNLNLYAAHTNLDSVYTGVNREIGRRLGIHKPEVLAPKENALVKLRVYVPSGYRQAVLDAIWQAGAGQIGEYSECSFTVSGMGTFTPGEGTNPFSGVSHIRSEEPEDLCEVVVPRFRIKNVLQALRAAHPYEEIAYDLIALSNRWQKAGSGMLGLLPEPLSPEYFLKLVSEAFQAPVIRHTAKPDSLISRVGWCGGSGSSLIGQALRAGCDAYLTADVKYHDFFVPNSQLWLCDIGHYESEQFTSGLIVNEIKQKFSTFAVRLSNVNTNPVNYYTHGG